MASAARVRLGTVICSRLGTGRAPPAPGRVWPAAARAGLPSGRCEPPDLTPTTSCGPGAQVRRRRRRLAETALTSAGGLVLPPAAEMRAYNNNAKIRTDFMTCLYTLYRYLNRSISCDYNHSRGLKLDSIRPPVSWCVVPENGTPPPPPDVASTSESASDGDGYGPSTSLELSEDKRRAWPTSGENREGVDYLR